VSFKIRLSRGTQKEQIELSAFDKLTGFAFTMFSTPATWLARRIPMLRDDILKSNLRITPEGLIADSFFFTALSAVAAAIGIFVGYGILHIIYFVALIAVVPLAFVISINMPKISASGRAASIEVELPFVIGYISILAGGGVSPLATLRRISTMKLFPSAAKEAKRILLDVDIFGQDPITAIESTARWNPNRTFSEFLYGYTAILKSGGNFMLYVQGKLRDVMEAKSSAVKRSADTTGTMAEAYLTVTVILGMVLYTLYMVQDLIAKSSGGLENLYFFAFIIVPMISAAFVWLIDAVQPKWPSVDYRPYKYLMYTAPAAAVAFFLPLGLPIYQRTSVSLVIGASLPAFFAMKYTREKRSLERVLPEFIRDVSEGRKTGLPPEVAIERLGDRHYGTLQPFVKKMGAQLSWGVSLSKVIKTFTDAVGSWITKAIGVLLIEVVDVGGGTIRSFADMADFTRDIDRMESERRAALRPFVFITYIAGIMVIVTTFILVYLLSAPAAANLGGASVLGAPSPGTIDLLLTTAVFDSFVIGIVAGKMGESGVSDGFKHAIALVVASNIAVVVARAFLHIAV
jgi:archaeal flagellar protein FlaJ